jgi:hypothetical protein
MNFQESSMMELSSFLLSLWILHLYEFSREFHDGTVLVFTLPVDIKSV